MDLIVDGFSLTKLWLSQRYPGATHDCVKATVCEMQVGIVGFTGQATPLESITVHSELFERGGQAISV